MSAIPSFSSLRQFDKWLIRQLQELGFGKLTFKVQSGMACPVAGYRIARTQKLLGNDSGCRREAMLANFTLSAEQVALLDHLRQFPDGTCLTVKAIHGLPASSVDIEEEHRGA